MATTGSLPIRKIEIQRDDIVSVPSLNPIAVEFLEFLHLNLSLTVNEGFYETLAKK